MEKEAGEEGEVCSIQANISSIEFSPQDYIHDLNFDHDHN
jgi:hypothetical protein